MLLINRVRKTLLLATMCFCFSTLSSNVLAEEVFATFKVTAVVHPMCIMSVDPLTFEGVTESMLAGKDEIVSTTTLSLRCTKGTQGALSSASLNAAMTNAVGSGTMQSDNDTMQYWLSLSPDFQETLTPESQALVGYQGHDGQVQKIKLYGKVKLDNQSTGQYQDSNRLTLNF